MAVLQIIKVGHTTLRKVASPVTDFDNALQSFVNDLIETMRFHDGIGLASTQVNILKRVFVIDKELINEAWDAQAYINPEILETEGMEKFEEGCLSIPNVRSDVDRPFKIRVRYQDTEGAVIEEELEGLLARVFQHEYDHLEGVLFIDRVPPLVRKMLEPQIREIEGAIS